MAIEVDKSAMQLSSECHTNSDLKQHKVGDKRFDVTFQTEFAIVQR